MPRSHTQVPAASERLNVPAILSILHQIEQHVRDDVSLDDFAEALAAAIARLVLLRAAAYRALVEIEREEQAGRMPRRRRRRQATARSTSAAKPNAFPITKGHLVATS